MFSAHSFQFKIGIQFGQGFSLILSDKRIFKASVNVPEWEKKTVIAGLYDWLIDIAVEVLCENVIIL